VYQSAITRAFWSAITRASGGSRVREKTRLANPLHVITGHRSGRAGDLIRPPPHVLNRGCVCVGMAPVSGLDRFRDLTQPPAPACVRACVCAWNPSETPRVRGRVLVAKPPPPDLLATKIDGPDLAKTCHSRGRRSWLSLE
jgi:hypothetical protein